MYYKYKKREYYFTKEKQLTELKIQNSRIWSVMTIMGHHVVYWSIKKYVEKESCDYQENIKYYDIIESLIKNKMISPPFE